MIFRIYAVIPRQSSIVRIITVRKKNQPYVSSGRELFNFRHGFERSRRIGPTIGEFEVEVARIDVRFAYICLIEYPVTVKIDNRRKLGVILYPASCIQMPIQ